MLVQKAKELPKWMSAIIPFLAETWILIIFVVIITQACLIIVKTVNKEVSDAVKIFLNLFGALLFISNRQQRRSSERRFFILFVYFSLVTSLYQGYILSFLTVPRHFH